MQTSNRFRLVVAALMVAASGSALAADPASGWTLIGRLGVMQFVIVPEGSARDRDYYQSVIQQLCGADGSTCFLHFFTNSKGVPVTMPPADEIYAESAARFHRSAKQGRESFMFNCRLKVPDAECF
jgi:hypothetical protein